LVGSSEAKAKKVPGLVKKSELFCRVFELPSPRNAQKRDKQNQEKNGFGFFLPIVLKNFSKRFFWERFLVGSSKVNQIYAGVRRFCFECPLEGPPKQNRRTPP
jgi:hypothetical protein